MKRLLTGSALLLAMSFAPACDKKEDDKDKSASADKDKKAEGGAASGDTKDGEAKEGGLAGAVKDAADTAEAGSGAGSAELVKFVPEGAKMLVVFDAKSVFGMPIIKDNMALIEQGEGAEMFAAAKGCNVGPETWSMAAFGGDPDEKDNIVLAGQATGLGKKETLECIAKKVNEKEGSDKWKVSEADGKVVVEIDGGDATGYSAGDDVFLIAGKGYSEDVKALVAGNGKSAIDGSLKETYAGADKGKHIYFAGVATADMAQGPTAGLKSYSGHVDFSKGLAVAASLEFGDEAKAKSTAEMFTAQFQGLKGMATGMGVPQPIIDSVKIEAKGTAVVASMNASAEDLQKVQDLAKKQMGA